MAFATAAVVPNSSSVAIAYPAPFAWTHRSTPPTRSLTPGINMRPMTSSTGAFMSLKMEPTNS